MMGKTFSRVVRERGGTGQLAHMGRNRGSTGLERGGECLDKKIYGDRRDGCGISHGRDLRGVKN